MQSLVNCFFCVCFCVNLIKKSKNVLKTNEKEVKKKKWNFYFEI